VSAEGIEDAIDRLCMQFPDPGEEVIKSVYRDSLRLVTDMVGEPESDKAEEIARTRLEVRTRRPAIPLKP